LGKSIKKIYKEIKNMKKEGMIFIGIFLFLAIGMHFKEWMSHPIEHIMALPSAGAYGLGAIHPLIFTFIVYLVFIIFRSLKRLVTRKK
jgi:Na+/H+ antiporter NhaC